MAIDWDGIYDADEDRENGSIAKILVMVLTMSTVALEQAMDSMKVSLSMNIGLYNVVLALPGVNRQLIKDSLEEVIGGYQRQLREVSKKEIKGFMEFMSKKGLMEDSSVNADSVLRQTQDKAVERIDRLEELKETLCDCIDRGYLDPKAVAAALDKAVNPEGFYGPAASVIALDPAAYGDKSERKPHKRLLPHFRKTELSPRSLVKSEDMAMDAYLKDGGELSHKHLNMFPSHTTFDFKIGDDELKKLLDG